MVLVLLTNFFYALGYSVSKMCLSSSQPIFLVAMRLLIGGILVLSYQKIRGKSFKLPEGSWIPLILSGITGFYAMNVLSFWGLLYITATRAAFIDNLSPLLSAILESVIFKDRLKVLEWLGLIIATVGIIPALSANTSNNATSMFGGLQWADIIIILSNVAFILGFICMRKVALHKDYDSVLANGISMIIGGTCALTHSLLCENWSPLPVYDQKSTAIFLVIMIVIYIIVNNLYSYLARDYTVTTLVLSGFSVPFFTAFFEYLTSGVFVTSEFWISTIFVALGLLCYFAQRYVNQKTSNEAKAVDNTHKIHLGS